MPTLLPGSYFTGAQQRKPQHQQRTQQHQHWQRWNALQLVGQSVHVDEKEYVM